MRGLGCALRLMGIDGPRAVARAAAWNAGTRCFSCLAIFRAKKIGGDREVVCGCVVIVCHIGWRLRVSEWVRW
jgi:hypothetical protein